MIPSTRNPNRSVSNTACTQPPDTSNSRRLDPATTSHLHNQSRIRRLRLNYYLEAARIGSLHFVFAASPSDQIGDEKAIDTFATRLSAQPLRRTSENSVKRKFAEKPLPRTPVNKRQDAVSMCCELAGQVQYPESS